MNTTSTTKPQLFSILGQICKRIAVHLVAKLARETGVRDKTRAFTPWSHVVTLLYAQPAHALSLDDGCDGLSLVTGRLQAIRGAKAGEIVVFDKACVVFSRKKCAAACSKAARFRAASCATRSWSCRRQVEVFFKQIKQTLQLADFLGPNENAVRWQVWTALLLYVLLRFVAWVHGSTGSFSRLFTLLRATLWMPKNLAALLHVMTT